MKTVLIAALLLSAGLANAQAPSGQDDYDAHLARTAELSELVWEFQSAGTDLCESKTAYLPGFAVGNDAASVMAASAGGDLQDLPKSIIRVFPGGPAAEAGLQAGDRILEINGETAHGKTWRGHSRWDAAWDAAKASAAATRYRVERAGASVDVTVAPRPVCDIQLAYVQGTVLAPRTPGVLVVTPVIDQVATERWERLAFLAPEVAVSMNQTAGTRRGVERAGGLLSDALANLTGVDVGQVIQLGSAKAFSKKQRLEGDRVGMFLLARLGVDVTQVPAYWQKVYAAPSDDHWASTFFGTRPTLAERQGVLETAIADIQALLQAGLPLDPDGGA